MTDVPSRDDDGGRDSHRATAGIAWSLGASTLGSIGVVVAYWSDAVLWVQGSTLAVAFGGLAVAAGLWGRRDLPQELAIEHRSPMPSSERARRAVTEAASIDEGGRRRRVLRALVAAAGSALLLALASPFRSLAPSPLPARTNTRWRAGRRLVDEDGSPVRLRDFGVGSVLTVFPEGDDERSDSQVILVRVDRERLRLPDDRMEWAPGGAIGYSKVCTHAGCPVGLYDADTTELFCPCHQSVFLASEGARPTFGPAARALPQLPIGVDPQGYLIALDDFPEPVGPSFWSMP